MQTSNDGVEFTIRHEGEVLKAYLCPAGHWTIGPGLTKASGVVDPMPGMTITRDQSRALLAKALSGNYEPAVARAMPSAKQHEFDGAVSFHFNTGAIHRASWVRSWIAGDWDEVSRRIKLWKKGGGRVLPGLVRRRQEEYDLIAFGVYEGAPKAVISVTLARIVVPVTPDEIARIRDGFILLGYDPRSDERGVSVGAVAKFQADHDLTVDAIIGRATLSTLQRRLDARDKSKTTATTTSVSAGATGGAGASDAIPMDQSLMLVVGVVAVAGLWTLYLGWTYRDVIAAKLQARLPNVARSLRSF